MSKRKKVSIKTAPRQPVKVDQKSKSTWLNFDSKSKVYPLCFLLGLSVLFVVFLVIFSRTPDFENPIIASKKGLIFFQYFIFSLLTACFGYFGWRFTNSVESMVRLDRMVLILSFLAVGSIYIMAFTEQVSPNGDNAEYLIIAKSLVERGAAFRLENPSENPNKLASIGLPLLLAPIYKIWGFDFVKMKILIMAMAVLIFPLLYLLFERRHGFALASLLTIAAVTSPYLVGNSTDMMTETPYLFWSLIALATIIKFQETPQFSWKYYFVVIATIIMTYLTRAIGIGALGALLVYLAWNVSWSKIFKNGERRELLSSPDFKKLLYSMTPLLVAALAWQIWQQTAGQSQANIFFSMNIFEFLEQNCHTAYRVLGQMMFSAETFRFENFISATTLPPMDVKYTMIFLLLLWGLWEGLRRKQLIAIYSLIVFAVIMLASVTPAEMVIIRYLSVLLPFIIYFMFTGTHDVLHFITSRLNISTNSSFAKVASVLLLAQILFTNMQGNSINMMISVAGNGPAYLDFVDVSKWAKNNLPDNAYVMSVKPRLFYLFSGKKGARLSTVNEEYSAAFEKEKLELFKTLGITHILLDGISGSTRKNIFPIVKNHPDMFQTLYIGSTSGSSSISKIIYKTD